VLVTAHAFDFTAVCWTVEDETTHRKLHRVLAEYAIARAEHRLACQLLADRPQTGDLVGGRFPGGAGSPLKTLSLPDQVDQLVADSGLEALDAVED